MMQNVFRISCVINEEISMTVFQNLNKLDILRKKRNLLMALKSCFAF